MQGVHCGCIVSSQLQAFALLDPGGIECSMCARKNVFLVGTKSTLRYLALSNISSILIYSMFREQGNSICFHLLAQKGRKIVEHFLETTLIYS